MKSIFLFSTDNRAGSERRITYTPRSVVCALPIVTGFQTGVISFTSMWTKSIN